MKILYNLQEMSQKTMTVLELKRVGCMQVSVLLIWGINLKSGLSVSGRGNDYPEDIGFD